MPSVSTIIISYNTKDLTRRALASLGGSSMTPDEVIVVDNNSIDGSVEMIEQEFPNVIIIKNKENLGFAKANNQAINIARGKYIWLLNSDTEVGKLTLSQLYQFMENNDLVAALGPQLTYSNGSWQSIGGYFPSVCNVFLYMFPVHNFLPVAKRIRMKLISNYPQKIEHNQEVDYITGAAIFLRKSALDQVGLLGEEYFMYFEETDLCWRLKKSGYKIMAIETEPVMHIYGGSFKKKTDKKRLGWFIESLKKFVNKNYSGLNKYLIVFELNIFSSLSMGLKSFKK